MRKISNKIILAITLCVALVSALIGAISIFQSKAQIEIEAEANLLNLVSNEAKEIERSLKETELLTDTIVQYAADSIDLNRVANNQDEMDAYELEIAPGLQSIIKASINGIGYIVYNSNEIQGGNTLSYSFGESGELKRANEYDANELDKEGNAWWYVPLEQGDFWTKPYKWTSKVTNEEENLISYCRRVVKDDQIIAVAGTDLKVDQFIDQIKQIKIYNSGYMVLLDQDMDTIYHPNEEVKNFKTYNNGELLDLVNQIESSSNKVDIVHYKLGGKGKIAAFYKLPNGWTALACPYLNEMYAGQKYLMWILIGITGASIILSIIIAYVLGKSISKPIVKFMKDVEVVATGDLSVNIQVTSKDEIGMLQESFISMIDNMKMQADAAKRIAAGQPTEVQVRSDADVLALGLKGILESNEKLLFEINNIASSAAAGDLSVRGDETAFEGNWKQLVQGLNELIEKVEKPVTLAGNYIAMMAEGDKLEILDPTQFEGYYSVLIENLNKVRESLYTMIEEGNKFAEEVTKGNLSHKADLSKLKGSYLQIVGGFIKAIEETINPIEEASDVLSEMANGNLQSRVVGDYNGDHAVIKNALNETLETLGTYIQEISTVLTEMANSNMNLEIVNDYKGDFAPIKDGLNLIINTFNSVLFDMNNAAEQVASGAGQVSDGSNELSQGATEQASSIEELTSSIAQVASQTKQNATNANEANNLALEAKTDAEEGNGQMRQMLDSMDEINEASNNIAKIIKVIDEIAFQTNILALNAAVEAARAGQHGKGFAVVAEEVRNLAQRSANAAQETTDLIEGSMKKVEIGTDIANKTAEALEKIVDGVTKAADLVGQIAEASNEQATGITQINQGIEQVAKVTQTNSATAEESAAASEELSSQAGLLKEMVSQFNIKNKSNNQPVKALPGKVQLDEAALTLDKPQIDLNDDEFGKY